MGLDMYLTGKQYVSTYDHNLKDVQLQMMLKTVLKKWNMGNDKKQIDYPVQYIEFQIMQWRKANQIHNWFVEKVQSGEDDCGWYYVSEQNCKDLLFVCEKVIANSTLVDGQVQNGSTMSAETGGKFVPNMEQGKYIQNSAVAQETLPCSSGFFFGSEDYNEWYLDDIKETATVLKKILDHDLFAHLEIYYSSSW